MGPLSGPENSYPTGVQNCIVSANINCIYFKNRIHKMVLKRSTDLQQDA